MSKIHGEYKTSLHVIWRAMKYRCMSASYKYYARYGGRGISVCPEWQDFVPFRDWAASNGYVKGLLLDRKDNDGNYEPSNCRWSTSAESGENKSNVRLNKDQVLMIRDLLAAGTMVKVLAALFGVNKRTVSGIKCGVIWRHVK